MTALILPFQSYFWLEFTAAVMHVKFNLSQYRDMKEICCATSTLQISVAMRRSKQCQPSGSSMQLHVYIEGKLQKHNLRPRDCMNSCLEQSAFTAILSI